MPYIKVNDIQMYYEIHGDGEPLVLIVGLGTDISEWDGIIHWLAQKYQVLALAEYSGWRQSEMCRNIRTLFNVEPPVTEEEILAASLQFGRKISGFNKPSRTNEAAFYAAVDDIARISGRLLGSLESPAAPKNRQEEAAKAKARRSEIRQVKTP